MSVHRGIEYGAAEEGEGRWVAWWLAAPGYRHYDLRQCAIREEAEEHARARIDSALDRFWREHPGHEGDWPPPQGAQGAEQGMLL